MVDQSRSLTRSISCRKYERRGKQKRLHSFRTLVFYILGLELLNLQADQLSPEGCSGWLLNLMQEKKNFPLTATHQNALRHLCKTHFRETTSSWCQRNFVPKHDTWREEAARSVISSSLRMLKFSPEICPRHSRWLIVIDTEHKDGTDTRCNGHAWACHRRHPATGVECVY